MSKQYKSALIYSRDNQIGLCRKVHDMLEKIKDGSFEPDKSRVHRLLQLTAERAREMDAEDDSDSSSESTDASSVAPSEGQHNDHERAPIKRLAASDINLDLCIINMRSKVIHLEVEGHNKFWCGRSSTSSFRKAMRSDIGSAEAVICANCSNSCKSRSHQE